jgi:hypothetical protein
MRTNTLTQKRLKEVVKYDRRAGLFYWRITVGKAVRGAVAGHTDSRGYTKLSIDGVKYFAHRLAWLYVRGEWPLQNIDHKDLCRNNNKFLNLRDVGQSMNGLNGPIRCNNSSGYTGVSYDTRRKNWVAYVHRGRRKKHLGAYKTLTEAAIARRVAINEIFNSTSK